MRSFLFSRRGLLAAALGLLAFTTAGCGNDSAATTAAPDGKDPRQTSQADAYKKGEGNSGGDAKKLRLAFVSNNAADFWTIARKGTEKAAAELPNVTVDFQMPSEQTAAKQKQILDDLLVKGVDGVAISPIDPKNQTEFLNKIAEKAALVTQDSDAPASNRLCYIGTDNVAAGRQAGELIKSTLPQGGKIMLFVGTMDAQNARERSEGIRDALKGSQVTVLDIRTDDADRVKAKQNVADTLVKSPDIAALVGLWAYNGPAILSAVRDANKIGKVKIIAFDEEDDTLAGVKEGAIAGTIVQQPFEFGYQSIINMAKYAGGDKSVFPTSKKIIVPTKVITKAEVEAFTKQLKELRGK